MNWDRVNIWTNTLYTLIHSLHIAKQIRFGNLSFVHDSIADAGTWITPDCSFASVLLPRGFGGNRPTFRRDPNLHFADITNQVVKMLVQDLVVIMDEMMTERLAALGQKGGNYPQSKIKTLSKRLDAKYLWASRGCLELVAARNVLTHCGGRWDARNISIVAPFVSPAPTSGDPLIIGFSMLFRYRKAMRTFLNEVGRP